MQDYNPSDIEEKWPFAKAPFDKTQGKQGKLDYNHREIELKWPHFAEASRGKQANERL